MNSRAYKIAAILAIATFIIGVVLVVMPIGRSNAGQIKEFTIEKGQSLGSVAYSLSKENIIFSRYVFVFYAVFSGHEKDFKAGKYLISKPVSIYKLVNIFSSGLAESDDIEVTIPEGSNVNDIDAAMAKAGLIKRGEVLKAANVFEGLLFPDTYRFAKDSGAAGIIEKMRGNFEIKTKILFRHINSQKIREVLIVASILEKEVKTEQDMRLVAGIIYKRVSLSMPLEVDATVAYGVCRQKFLLGEYCDVSLANIVDNISVDSAYNTYKRRGLPAGPISNPGLAAMNAALNPLASDYLYYLTAKDGTTIFSKTSAEHLRARQKYLK